MMQEHLRAGRATLDGVEGHVWFGEVLEGASEDDLIRVMASNGIKQPSKRVLDVMENGSHPRNAWRGCKMERKDS